MPLLEGKLTGIFNSISGEVSPAGIGRQTTFVRFYGCPVQCKYCDTPQNVGDILSGTDDELFEYIEEMVAKTGNLCITGGEPLIHKESVAEVLDRLDGICNTSWIETSGCVSFKDLADDHCMVVDYKLPSSGCTLPPVSVEEYSELAQCDFIKFVIRDYEDFNKACKIACQFESSNSPQLAFSPMADEKGNFILAPGKLFEWMQDTEFVNCFLNVQLHKLVNMQ